MSARKKPTPPTPTDQVQWMRALGVISAQWSPDGSLLCATLGPPPPPPRERQDDTPINPALVREQYRQIALAAGARLVKRDQ